MIVVPALTLLLGVDIRLAIGASIISVHARDRIVERDRVNVVITSVVLALLVISLVSGAARAPIRVIPSVASVRQIRLVRHYC